MKILEKLIEITKPFYKSDDPGHDFAHITRVMNTCKELALQEGADLEILLPAALLHDVVNVPKNSPQRSRASELAANKGAKLMKEVGYDEEAISKTHQAIVEHSFSRGLSPSSIESKILQDADRLDALGAIGIMRTISCGVAFGASYYNVDDPFSKNRELDDKNYTLDHFYTKLFKLADMMNTDSGKKEAHKRMDFMKVFVEKLSQEIELT